MENQALTQLITSFRRWRFVLIPFILVFLVMGGSLISKTSDQFRSERILRPAGKPHKGFIFRFRDILIPKAIEQYKAKSNASLSTSQFLVSQVLDSKEINIRYQGKNEIDEAFFAELLTVVQEEQRLTIAAISKNIKVQNDLASKGHIVIESTIGGDPVHLRCPECKNAIQHLTDLNNLKLESLKEAHYALDKGQRAIKKSKIKMFGLLTLAGLVATVLLSIGLDIVFPKSSV